jgi:hypothetical protein
MNSNFNMRNAMYSSALGSKNKLRIFLTLFFPEFFSSLNMVINFQHNVCQMLDLLGSLHVCCYVFSFDDGQTNYGD